MSETAMLSLLIEARAHVDAGWVKSSWFTTTMRDDKRVVDKVCAKAALILASGGGIIRGNECAPVITASGLANEAERFLVSLLPPTNRISLCDCCVGGRQFPDLPSFNDFPDTTKKDVLALFDKAIAQLTPPPPEPVFTGPVVALPALGQSKVTYTIDPPTMVPNTVPAGWVQDVKVLVGSP